MIKSREVEKILKEIYDNLESKNYNEALNNINCYMRNIEYRSNETIKKLILKHRKNRQKYGEFSEKTIEINKKINEEIVKINNMY